MLSRRARSSCPSHAVKIAPGQGRRYRGMATMAGRDLIKLYELANLSSYRRETLHQHGPGQLPLRQGLPREDSPERIHTRLHPKKGLADESSTPPPSEKPPLLRQRWPAPPRAASSSTLCSRFMKGSVSSSPRLLSLSFRNRCGIQALLVRRKKEERQ